MRRTRAITSRLRRLRRLLRTLLAAAALAPSAHAGPGEGSAAGATRYALLELHARDGALIGAHVTDDALRDALATIPDEDAPELVVLRIDSPGGMLREVPDLADLITLELAPTTRVVAWVDDALSAAALTALACPEIVMTSDGMLGAAVAFKDEGGRVVALRGDDLERALAVGAEIARRTGRDPRPIRAMQTPTPLSYDVDERGGVHLRSDTRGQRPLCDETSILTLNATSAVAIRVAIGTADTPDELLGLLGVEHARDVVEPANAAFSRHAARVDAAIARMRDDDERLCAALDRAHALAADGADNSADLAIAEDALASIGREAARFPDAAACIGLGEVPRELYRADLDAARPPAPAPTDPEAPLSSTTTHEETP